jgi:DNA-binding IclR family transcriptional regulator
VSAEAVPEPVLRFIDRHIESVEHLEILLLLSQDIRDWSVGEIFKSIQSSEASVTQRLQQLTAAGLLASNGLRFRFEPRDESMRQLVADLGDLYRERRVRVIEAIYSRKTDAVQTFADAFKFKQKE